MTDCDFEPSRDLLLSTAEQVELLPENQPNLTGHELERQLRDKAQQTPAVGTILHDLSVGGKSPCATARPPIGDVTVCCRPSGRSARYYEHRVLACRNADAGRCRGDESVRLHARETGHDQDRSLAPAGDGHTHRACTGESPHHRVRMEQGSLMRRSQHQAARATEDRILALGERIHEMSKHQIAAMLGVHPNTVRNTMIRLGLAHDSSRAQQARTPDRWTGHEILQALRLDLTMGQIGHRLGRTPESVNAVRTRVRQGDEALLRWLADEGGIRLSKRPHVREAELAILGLGGRLPGMTKAEIGRRLGYRGERVRLAMQRMGLDPDRFSAHLD